MPTLRGFTEKYFTHAVGYPLIAMPFYKDFTPARGSQFPHTFLLPQEVL